MLNLESDREEELIGFVPAISVSGSTEIVRDVLHSRKVQSGPSCLGLLYYQFYQRQSYLSSKNKWEFRM